MNIEQEIINNLLYNIEDLGISQQDYETEYYKEFEKKRDSYREVFKSLLSPELQDVYNSVCDMEDYDSWNNFNMGKIVGFTIAMALQKTLDNPLKAHNYLTASWRPINEAYKVDDEIFNNAIIKYKKERDK